MHTTILSWQLFILSRIETYIWILLLTSLAQLSHFSQWILLWFPSSYCAQIIAHPQNNGCLFLPSPNCPNVSELLVHSLLCFQVQIWIHYPVVLLPTQVEKESCANAFLLSQEIYHGKLHNLLHFSGQPLFRSFCCLFSVPEILIRIDRHMLCRPSPYSTRSFSI